MASLHICLILSGPSSQTAIECHLCEQRRLWRVCTFALAYLSLRDCTKSCAALNGDLCAIHPSSEYSGESVHLRRQSGNYKVEIVF